MNTQISWSFSQRGLTVGSKPKSCLLTIKNIFVLHVQYYTCMYYHYVFLNYEWYIHYQQLVLHFF